MREEEGEGLGEAGGVVGLLLSASVSVCVFTRCVLRLPKYTAINSGLYIKAAK